MLTWLKWFGVVLISLILAVWLVGLILAGTRWTVPRSAAVSASYEHVAYWTGEDFPSNAFAQPIGVAVSDDGDLYVTDAERRVVHLSSRGRYLDEWGREGNQEGELSQPMGVEVGGEGHVFVTDYDRDRVLKFSPEGGFLMELGSSGSKPGELDAPGGVTVDEQGSIYVTDFYNHRVQKFSPEGEFEKVLGRPGRIGVGALHYPTDIELTPDGELIVADAYNYQLQWFAGDGLPTKRIGYHLFWLWPRPREERAGFHVPSGVAVGVDGNIHVADSGNHRVVMLSPRGRFLTAWEMPEADRQIHSPEKVAVSPDGSRLYATDFPANRIVVLKINAPE